MLSTDVDAILTGVPKTPSTPVSSSIKLDLKTEKKTPKATVKKPEGISREAFNLVSSCWDEQDLISSVMPVNLGYKKTRASVGTTRARRFHWTPFKNEGRNDGLELCHWVREDQLNTGEPYRFSRFNKVLNCPTYNEKEYYQHLVVSNWTKDETDKLFELCRSFDIRWPIVHDRYGHAGFTKSRSMEDLKERFYSIVNELQRLQNPEAPEIAFDAENERCRKEQLDKLWNRTKEEVEEEAELLVQMQAINARRKEREQRAREVNKMLSELYAEKENPETLGDQSVFKAPRPLKKVQRMRAGSDCVAPATSGTEDAMMKVFRQPEFKNPGAHLRTHEILQVRGRNPCRKEKTIRYLMAMCRLDIRYTMGTEQIVELYNDFKKNTMLLQFLKESLLAAELELSALKLKAASTGKVIGIPPRIVVSTIPESGLSQTQVTGEEDAPATVRRLTAAVDKLNMNFDKNGVPIIPPECLR